MDRQRVFSGGNVPDTDVDLRTDLHKTGHVKGIVHLCLRHPDPGDLFKLHHAMRAGLEVQKVYRACEHPVNMLKMKRFPVDCDRIRLEADLPHRHVLRLETQHLDSLDRHPLVVLERKPELNCLGKERLQTNPVTEYLRDIIAELSGGDVNNSPSLWCKSLPSKRIVNALRFAW